MLGNCFSLIASTSMGKARKGTTSAPDQETEETLDGLQDGTNKGGAHDSLESIWGTPMLLEVNFL